ncbi:MAG TPA: NAD-dependent epimerase/dehydratase family protein [Gryllotalpicola sp.]
MNSVAPLRVLFLGGTGIISAGAVREAVAQGMEVYVLNRGINQRQRDLPDAVKWLTGDVGQPASVATAIEGLTFDTVINFLSFTAEHAQQAVELFTGVTKQYIYISSASVYHKPVALVPVVESNLKKNEFLQYARDKIAGETVLMTAHLEQGFPVTIVRPSHTYDDANPPLAGSWVVFDRMEQGKEILVHGDGTSLWTVTHSSDFAVGLVGLFGNPLAIGEDFHITSDDVYSWDQIFRLIGAALGVEPKLVHVPSELIHAAAPEWGWSELFLGDLAHSAIFDNSKIRRFVPAFNPKKTFVRTVRDLAAWREAHRDAAVGEPDADAIMDRVVTGYHEARKIFEGLAPQG